VRFTTVLPERAAPNLALAGLLTWDESLRTDFSQEAAPLAAGPKLPATVAERLKMPILAEFNRTPLEEAFTAIGDSIQVTFTLDGEALEGAAYTRNMPQTFNLGTAPAIRAVAEILKQYDQMCIVVDEKTKTVTVTTKKAATDRGLTPYPVATAN
ncbi:MAG: hypothetical protein ACREJB_18900, partial [Planctomycetaceae bacterium]